MKHSFVRAAAVSPQLKVADVTFNAANIIAEIQTQTKAGVEILVFPELSLCGCTCGDLLLQKTLTDACMTALTQIAKATQNTKMLVFLGLPVTAQNRLYNCAAGIANGKVLGFVPQTLPDNGELNGRRHFAKWTGERMHISLPNGETAPLSADLLFTECSGALKVACEVEDLRSSDGLTAKHVQRGAAVVVNLFAESQTVGKREYRKMLIGAQSAKNACAYLCADAGTDESTSDMVFSGNHLIYENGTLLAEAEPFSENAAVAEIDVAFLEFERKKLLTLRKQTEEIYSEIPCSFFGEGELKSRHISRTPFVPEGGEAESRCELILNIQAHALKKRLEHTGVQTAVLGVSGGLDSALALLVTARAFDLIQKPRKEIIAVTMPGFGTTVGTKNNSALLAEAAGATLKEIGIAKTVLSHFGDIGHNPETLDATYENAQARYRTMILMDLANQTNGLVIGTGDMSELALGWCTYNGDHMSMYSVNSSVPKTLVKHLVAYEAKRLGGKTELALNGILDTEISPELLPPDKAGNIAQKTEDIVGPYELHDFYLYQFVRRGSSAEKTLYLAEIAFKGKFDKKTLKKWLVNFYRRFFSQQYKRNCAPDGVKVGSVSLSQRGDWRMPSDALAELWLADVQK